MKDFLYRPFFLAKKLQKLWQKDAKQGKRKKRKNDVRD
jgi:hypothetical protein